MRIQQLELLALARDQQESERRELAAVEYRNRNKCEYEKIQCERYLQDQEKAVKYKLAKENPRREGTDPASTISPFQELLTAKTWHIKSTATQLRRLESENERDEFSSHPSQLFQFLKTREGKPISSENAELKRSQMSVLKHHNSHESCAFEETVPP